MTSKRELEKRLERLETERETQRTVKELFDGEIDEAVVDAIIEFATQRLSGTSTVVSADVVASLPAAFQEQYEVPTGDGGD